MIDKYYMPRTLDEPFRIFLLTIDEVIVLMFPILIIGFITDQMITGIILGALLLVSVKKLKGEQGHYYLVNLVYWYLPPLIKFKVTPNSYIKHYLG